MSSKTGFGTISGIVNSTTNKSLVINLASHGTKRIFDIFAGYTLRTGAANTVLIGGRVIVVGGKFDNSTEFISPTDFELSTSIGGFNTYFDMPVGEGQAGPAVAIAEKYNFQNGLLLPDSQEASVILTCCFGDALAKPAAADVNAFLTVNGLVAGSDKIFKNV